MEIFMSTCGISPLKAEHELAKLHIQKGLLPLGTIHFQTKLFSVDYRGEFACLTEPIVKFAFVNHSLSCETQISWIAIEMNGFR